MVRKEAKYDHKFYEDIGEGEQTKNRYTPSCWARNRSVTIPQDFCQISTDDSNFFLTDSNEFLKRYHNGTFEF